MRNAYVQAGYLKCPQFMPNIKNKPPNRFKLLLHICDWKADLVT